MFSRSSFVSFVIATFLLSPMAAIAAPVSNIVNASAPNVSRADFISWTYGVLELHKEQGDCTLPFTRYPRGMKEILCSAKTQGVLDLFNADKDYFKMAVPITRGEALETLTALLDEQRNADVSSYRDARSEREKQAIMNAIVLKWMQPQSSTLFGVNRILTGSEALTLLQAASGDYPDRVKQKIIINVAPQASSGNLPQGELMNAVWQLVLRDYLHNNKIDTNEAAYKAIEGMVDSLNDPYSSFFRPVGASNFQSQIKGELSGIGAQIEEVNGVITIVTPLTGSPAEKAGLQPGDEILEANGNILTGIGSEKAVNFIRGEKGTQVILKIRRKGNEMIVTVTRDIISIPEISVKWQGQIAIVTLAQFGETTQKRIRSVLTDVQKQNPQGLILDLRNNGGGLLNAADTVVSNFVPKGSVVTKIKNRTETNIEYTQDEPTILSSVKMVVLVNKGSASASEITAGALQDMKRATIVGAQTFGKGSVQEVVTFQSGEALKLTIAEWLTPLDRTIEGVGIKPDIVIDSDDRDEQLRRALDILR